MVVGLFIASKDKEAPTGKVNRYGGYCPHCGGYVAARAGVLVKRLSIGRNGGQWAPAHLSCENAHGAAVSTITIGNNSYTRNVRGRCEDAPCCGCCTI